MNHGGGGGREGKKNLEVRAYAKKAREPTHSGAPANVILLYTLRHLCCH